MEREEGRGRMCESGEREGKRNGVGGGREGICFLTLDALISVWTVISNPIFLAIYALILVYMLRER